MRVLVFLLLIALVAGIAAFNAPVGAGLFMCLFGCMIIFRPGQRRVPHPSTSHDPAQIRKAKYARDILFF